jgi:hypothetical protein
MATIDGCHTGFFHYDPERRTYCMITIPAPWRDTPGLTWQFVAAMLRNQRRELTEKPLPRPGDLTNNSGEVICFSAVNVLRATHLPAISGSRETWPGARLSADHVAAG